MADLIISIFLAAFFVNLLYEFLHSFLYKTCLEAGAKKYIFLIMKASVVDGLWIAAFYLITYFAFKNINPLSNAYQLALFFFITVPFAYFWEIYSIKKMRWEYAKNMPLVVGAGLTPLVQLFITGLISFYIVFAFAQ